MSGRAMRWAWSVLLLLGACSLPVLAAADLIWDSTRHAGALATGEAVVVLREVMVAGQAARLQAEAEIPAPGARHLAAGPDNGLVYASATAEGQLKFIDLATAQQVHQVPAAAPQPGPLLYHPVLHKLASFNGPGTVTLFDTQSRAYEGLLPLGAPALAALLAPDGRVVAALPEQGQLLVLALRPFRVLARLPLPPSCQAGPALVADPATLRVFLPCATGQIAVFDLRQGEWLTDWQPAVSPAGTDLLAQQLFWDATGHRLLALTAQGQLVQCAPTQAEARILLRLPAGSVAAWDSPAQRLVVATPAEGASAAAPSFAYSFQFVQVP